MAAGQMFRLAIAVTADGVVPGPYYWCGGDAAGSVDIRPKRAALFFGVDGAGAAVEWACGWMRLVLPEGGRFECYVEVHDPETSSWSRFYASPIEDAPAA